MQRGLRMYLALPNLSAEPGLAGHHLGSSHALVACKVAVTLTNRRHSPGITTSQLRSA